MKVIPAIDLRDGRCVRLFQGNFDEETQYSNDPPAVARRFAELSVADLHIVDLDGARDGEQKNQNIVRTIASETPLDVQLGGGLRDRDAVAQWFDAGVARCVIGSMAVTDPDDVKSWMTEFGPDRIVLALDVRITASDLPLLSTHGWKQTSSVSLWECVEDFVPVGLRHVLCTDVGRDGAMSGPNVSLYREFAERFPDVELQASGGVRDIEDLQELDAAGASAAITGRALLDGKLTPQEVLSFLRDA